MATTKELNEKVANLTMRVSNLKDEIHTLREELHNFRNHVASDVRILSNAVDLTGDNDGK
tara:strand:+ start:206 stop:385 length:180 start_codon:yes stop_codon:yes gene_type:complete